MPEDAIIKQVKELNLRLEEKDEEFRELNAQAEMLVEGEAKVAATGVQEFEDPNLPTRGTTLVIKNKGSCRYNFSTLRLEEECYL